MAGQPNILLFVTDDHGPWAIGCYGNSEVRSPSLDRLAQEGVRFAHAFTPTPVCSPARACLLTGRTSSQTGLHDYLAPPHADRDWAADELTLQELLADAGYVCGYSGKRHLGAEEQTPRGCSFHFASIPGGPRGGHLGSRRYVFNGAVFDEAGNYTQRITDYALRFLDGAPSDRPFFLTVGYIATHSPYTGQEPELVASYADATFRDIPPYRPHPWRHNESFPTDYAYTHEDLPYTEEDVRERRRNQYAAVTDIDRNLARLRERLAADGRLDDTVVIYTSDHGLSHGHRGFWGKGNGTRPLNMFETSIRVPLLVRYPRELPAGCVVERSVDHYDTFQSVCDFAGVDLARPELAARGYPGQSYRALARGAAAVAWRDARFGEYGDLRMIRTPFYKLVRRYPNGPDDLFDLQHDPNEQRNLAELPEYAAVRAELAAEIDRFYARHEDPARSGLRVKQLPQHNHTEAWRDGVREMRGYQAY